jgi:toxin ParE1/3/4
MASYSIDVHSEAVAEAHAAKVWYHERSPKLAVRFAAELDRAIAQIVEAPNRWSPFSSGTQRYFLKKFPFYVVYRVVGDVIQVIAVAHGRRRPGYWKTR